MAGGTDEGGAEDRAGVGERGSRQLDRGAVWKGKNQGGGSVCRITLFLKYRMRITGQGSSLFIIIYRITMGPGPGLVAHVLWRYCMRLASSGVGGVRRVRLALLYVECW